MDLSNLKNVGNDIEEKLSEIGKRLGAHPEPFTADEDEIEISGGQLAEDAKTHPGKPIIIEGKFHMAYIKDHSYYDRETHDRDVNQHPNHCFVRGNKVHFYYCRTLVSMTERGRRARYRATRRAENTRLIALADEEKDLRTRLALCKNCILDLCNNGEVFSNHHTLNKIAGYGDAEELMVCVKAHHNNDPSAVQKIRDFIENTT